MVDCGDKEACEHDVLDRLCLDDRLACLTEVFIAAQISAKAY